jgi:hypothetical protein
MLRSVYAVVVGGWSCQAKSPRGGASIDAPPLERIGATGTFEFLGATLIEVVGGMVPSVPHRFTKAELLQRADQQHL